MNHSDSVQFLQDNISRFVEFVDIIRKLEKDGLYIRIDDFTIISKDMARRVNFVNTLVTQSSPDLIDKTSRDRSRSRSSSPVASNYMSTQPSSSSSVSSGALRVRITNELLSSPSSVTTNLLSDDSDDESDDVNETPTVGENDDTIVFTSSQRNIESPESPPPAQLPYDDYDSPESPPVTQWHQIVDYPYREFAQPSHTYEGFSLEDIVYSIGLGKDRCDGYTSRVRLERAETIEEGARAECVICFDVTAFPNVTYIDCGHMPTCIRQWQKPCPACRSKFNVSVGRI